LILKLNKNRAKVLYGNTKEDYLFLYCGNKKAGAKTPAF
jgi:hypothetical protein